MVQGQCEKVYSMMVMSLTLSDKDESLIVIHSFFTISASVVGRNTMKCNLLMVEVSSLVSWLFGIYVPAA